MLNILANNVSKMLLTDGKRVDLGGNPSPAGKFSVNGKGVIDSAKVLFAGVAPPSAVEHGTGTVWLDSTYSYVHGVGRPVLITYNLDLSASDVYITLLENDATHFTFEFNAPAGTATPLMTYSYI